MAASDLALPKCLLESTFFLQLTEAQRGNFLYRQIRIRNISKLSKTLNNREISRDFLEELTLELYVCMSVGQAEIEVSPWFIQEMWNSDYIGRSKRTELNAVNREYLELCSELLKNEIPTVKEKIVHISEKIYNKQSVMLKSKTIETFLLLQMSIEAMIPLLLSLSVSARFELE